MSIKNQTRRTTIAKDAIEAKTYLQKTFGLIVYKIPTAMIFHTRFGIHTFFMRYPIDVLILDNRNKVVDLKESMRPWTFFAWNPNYDLVIELPEKTVKKSKTEIGNQIIIKKD